MDQDQKTACELLKSLRTELIDILSADPEFIRQHAYSRGLVTQHGYQTMGSLQTPMQQVTSLLDQVHNRGLEDSNRLLELLKGAEIQESFPKLSFLLNPDVSLNLSTEETSRSPAVQGSAEGTSSANAPPKAGPGLVTEKQLMKVAGAMPLKWRDAGILVLDISSNKLDEIQADNSRENMRAFRMLLHWRCLQREKATAAKLYSLLSSKDLALSPEGLECLQESS